MATLPARPPFFFSKQLSEHHTVAFFILPVNIIAHPCHTVRGQTVLNDEPSEELRAPRSLPARQEPWLTIARDRKPLEASRTGGRKFTAI